MPRCGTLVICVQNLDFSGANQVVFNIAVGRIHESNIVVLSPKNGAFGARFVESGAAVRIGNLHDLLSGIRDVFCIICNTIMTANVVVEMSNRPYPVIWILHEWWDDEMIIENLKIRNYDNDSLTLATIKKAMSVATCIVCVCESQRLMYRPTAPSTVIFVGIPDPVARLRASSQDILPEDTVQEALPILKNNNNGVFTFLCLGIICPRKNQLWTVQLFKKFAENKSNVRLQIVGARHTRIYEIEYLEKLKKEINHDPKIEIYDVTDNTDDFYKNADCLILTSLNEVTPMVIPESLAWGIPVLSTNIAGIKEMFTNGVEGFHFSPDDEVKALEAMEIVYSNDFLRNQMSSYARIRYEEIFDLNIIVEQFRQLVLSIAPPVILLDMDGVLVDWDKAFYEEWNNRCPIDRERSYQIEKCFDSKYDVEAELIFHRVGFFLKLDWMEGALEAIQEMEKEGFSMFIVTSPIKSSRYCAQEKIDWIRTNLGESWMEKVVLTHDKTTIAGDILIDDKPPELLNPRSRQLTPIWKQVIFDAPYNQESKGPRLKHWKDWRKVIYPLIGKTNAPPVIEKLNPVSTSDQELKPPPFLEDLNPSSSSFPPHPPPTVNAEKKKHISMKRSGVTAENLQKEFDQLHPSDQPLSAEDSATVLSGSFGLLDDDISLEEELFESMLDNESIGSLDENSLHNIHTNMKTDDVDYLSRLAEKKKLLQQKLLEVSATYQREKQKTEKTLYMETDAHDIEGIQIFSRAFSSWKRNHQIKKKKSNQF